MGLWVAFEAAGQKAVQQGAFGRGARHARMPMARQGVAAAVIAVVGFKVRCASGVETDEARGAVDPGGRVFEEVRFGAEGGTFVQHGVHAGSAQLDARGFARRRHEIRAVIGMDRQPDQMVLDGLPLRASVAPERAFGMDDAPVTGGQVFADALGDLDV